MSTPFSTSRIFLRNPYRPGPGPVVQPWIAPDRHSFITFRRHWPYASLAMICAVSIVATLPLQNDIAGFLAAIGIAVLYAAVSALLLLWEQHNATATLPLRQNVRGLRKVAMIAGLTAVLWRLPEASSELWLLYLIPMVTVGVDLDRRWAFTLIGVTMALMFLSAFPHPAGTTTTLSPIMDARDGLIRAFVGGWVGMTSYFLARCLAYQYKASRDAVDRLVQVPAPERWLDTMEVVAALVADLFSAPGSTVTANVLTFDPLKDKMRLAGSSRPDGQALVNSEFAFSSAQGVTGWAAAHNQPCFLNNTSYDPEHRFLPNPAFPHTRSALAVPFPLTGGKRAVLEIESPVPNNIAYEDLQLMELIASYLVGAHQTSEWIEFHRRLADLSKELADRIIHVQEIGAMLTKIGEVALDLVDADVIGFYYCDLETGLIEERRIVGSLLAPDIGGSPINAPDSLVAQLMQQGTIRFFGNAQDDEHLIRRGDWHQEHNVDPFVVREKIAACAALPLVLGQERLGLMWVNYRQKQDFPRPLQYNLQMLAQFAALAIKSGVQSAQAERQRRAKLHRDLHDSLLARLKNAALAMDRLSSCQPGTACWKETFQLAQVSVKWATTVVLALLDRKEWMTLQSIVADLEAQAHVSSRIYGTTMRLQAANLPAIAIDHTGGNELLFACNEAVNNALRHSQASCIDIQVEMQGESLYICIRDNGVGFDPALLKRVNGIYNMRVRIEESLAGHFTLASAPGAGTTVTIKVPLSNAGEDTEAASERSAA